MQKKVFEGREPSLDIRTFIDTKEYKGYTKKGINLPLDKGKELLKALQEVLEQQQLD